MLEKKIEQQAPLFSVELDKKARTDLSSFFISAVDMLLLIHDSEFTPASPCNGEAIEVESCICLE
jgi:hypothetical protein